MVLLIRMLIIGGVKYKLWTPKDEEKEFHPMVRANSKEIFGQDSIYFDVKMSLKSASGIVSIPDAYVINLSKHSEWYIIENELSTHSIFDHIVKQLTKFINGIENQNARSQILDMIYLKIKEDGILKAKVKNLIDTDDIHDFLSKLLSKPPRIVIVIDQKTAELEEATQVLKYHTDIIEFKTYARENAENIRAHLFEPLYTYEEPQATTTKKPTLEMEKSETKIEGVKAGDILEMEQKSINERKYRLFRLAGSTRRFFPGYKVNFILQTDIGNITSSVVSAAQRPQIGDPHAGNYISGGLKPWYDKHPEVAVGTKLRFECIEPYKKYTLTVVR